jgi:hypothetical protein
VPHLLELRLTRTDSSQSPEYVCQRERRSEVTTKSLGLGQILLIPLRASGICPAGRGLETTKPPLVSSTSKRGRHSSGVFNAFMSEPDFPGSEYSFNLSEIPNYLATHLKQEQSLLRCLSTALFDVSKPSSLRILPM